MQKPILFDLDFSELNEILNSWGEPSYRAEQIWHGIYKSFWVDEEDFTNIPIHLRRRVFDHFSFQPLKPIQVLNSTDGETQKIQFLLSDDYPVETVRMRYEKRRTLCVSTQSGCAIGCKFCATGQMGFNRNLSSGEIIEQVLHFARIFKMNNERVTNVVFMGMGEPFQNYENLKVAIDRMNHRRGMNLGVRRFTISTVGLVPGIKRLADERSQVNLAISLHAADDELRSSLLPINKNYPIETLFSSIKEYTSVTGRRVTLEWALIRGINDTSEQARKLADLAHGMLVHVNVIPLNPTEGYEGQTTTRQRSLAFKNILERHGISCTIRLRRGIDINAGCGQLASRSLE